jgi:membrane peptidoglycan carboxypeptidase
MRHFSPTPDAEESPHFAREAGKRTGMRARAGTRLGSAPRGGRWARPTAARGERQGQGGALTVVLAVAVFVMATIGGFAWSMDRQLRAGLLEQRDEAVRRGDWVALQELPPYVPLAFVVAVDPTFLSRSPLDLGLEGSTLSREVARQVHRLDDTLGGQARELVMGPLLEARLTEAELLELYLNRVHLGEDRGWPVYGIYHAAREYFDKEPQQLMPGEAAALAGMLLPPRITDPHRQVGAVGIRRNEVLHQMLEARAITPDEYAAAKQEPLGFQPGLEFVPMSRPAGWDRQPEVIRLPPEAMVPADTATVQ